MTRVDIHRVSSKHHERAGGMAQRLGKTGSAIRPLLLPKKSGCRRWFGESPGRTYYLFLLWPGGPFTMLSNGILLGAERCRALGCLAPSCLSLWPQGCLGQGTQTAFSSVKGR